MAMPPQPTPTETTPELADITLAFGGDVHFEKHVAALLDDEESLASLQDTLGAADISMINLETAVTERGTPIPGKKYTFRTSEESLNVLAAAGVDVVSLANNHGADYGKQGLADTLAAKTQSPIPMVGIGANDDEAFAPATMTAGGMKVAVFGSSQLQEQTSQLYASGPDKAGIATNLDTTKLVAAVKKAQEDHDVTVVYVHWGTERTVCPDDRQLRVIKDLEAAGADVVVGGHAHRPQGAGWMNNTFVGYGLGNFIWYRSDEPNSHAGVLTLTIDAAAVADRRAGKPAAAMVKNQEWTPMLIGKDGIPRTQDAATTNRLQQTYSKAVACSKLDQTRPTS